MPIKQIAGRTFGRLTVTRRAKNDPRGNARWMCACRCGQQLIVAGRHLRSGNTRSCGCLHRERTKRIQARLHLVHGGTRRGEGATGWGKFRREYRSWAMMIHRCTNPAAANFKHYGGRGIAVCKRWLRGARGKHPFLCFLEDMGRRPAGKSIDRIDGDGDYRPGNCRWATQIQQIRNRRRRSAPSRK